MKFNNFKLLEYNVIWIWNIIPSNSYSPNSIWSFDFEITGLSQKRIL